MTTSEILTIAEMAFLVFVLLMIAIAIKKHDNKGGKE